MPIVIAHTDDGLENVEEVQLFDESGEATLEAEVVTGFLEELDWDDVMDDEDVREFIELEDGYYKLDENGELVECKEGDEDAQLLVIETLEGEIAALFVDESDLFEMFKYYVGDMPEDTLEEKTLKAVFADILDEQDDEQNEAKKGPFKKGAFRKIHKAGGAPLVNRMLGAMMNKQSIKRAKAPGKGYKSGDYTKSAGYAPGTGSGIKKWKAYKMKKASELAKKSKQTKAAAKKGLKKVGIKAAPKKGSKKAGAKSLAKKKKAGKKMSASDTGTPPANMTEGKDKKVLDDSNSRPAFHRAAGHVLAGNILESMTSHQKPEKKKEEDKK